MLSILLRRTVWLELKQQQGFLYSYIPSTIITVSEGRKRVEELFIVDHGGNQSFKLPDYISNPGRLEDSVGEMQSHTLTFVPLYPVASATPGLHKLELSSWSFAIDELWPKGRRRLSALLYQHRVPLAGSAHYGQPVSRDRVLETPKMSTSTQNTNAGRGTQHNNNATQQNVNYGGGQVNNFNTTFPGPHKRSLLDAIAGVGASHKAEHQFTRGACLEGTREEVLAILRKWGLTEEQLLPICWLSGSAGVGKSSIALTITQYYEDKGTLVSSFFFFRSDPKRNNPSALMPTIAHGLATKVSLTQNHIEERISRDPTILDATLEEQFRELVFEPSLKWSRQRALWGSPVGPQIVVLDGLDECGNEETQLRILDIIRSAYEQNPQFPLRFLICSRPEAWIREAFVEDRFRKLSKTIVLDETFEPNRDIMRYYLHHFQEIARSPKYSQIPFPSPWPSERELEILVERSCGQFVYTATVVRFIKLARCHPIEQLSTIIDKTPSRRGASPYQQLDMLYDFILSVDPDHDRLLPILAAILVLPEATRSPANIELVLGLREGQVSLTLRGMHSVLNIRARGDWIRVYHTSFTDYLADQTRSLDCHINVKKQRRPIVRQWLQNLTLSRIRTYSLSQLHSEEIKPFFAGWIELCTLITKPSWKLLVDVQNVDLASVCMASAADRDWEQKFRTLLPWLENYHVPKRGSVKDKECLVQKLKKRPECFHLEWPPSTYQWDHVVEVFFARSESQDSSVLTLVSQISIHVMFWVVQVATGCVYDLEARKPRDPHQMPYLTDCRCDLSGGVRSCDPRHLAYQEACMQVVWNHISRIEKNVQKVAEGATVELFAPTVSEHFHNLVWSSLLKHCHLDTELLSLCRTFFELVGRCVKMELIFSKSAIQGRKNLVEWIEAFPDKFAEEGEGLKAQLLAWPSGQEVDEDTPCETCTRILATSRHSS
ncbi:hypothetical protein PQX77_011085 [Marasmius sp. AFHP31]|nr:hypothetical protein PQX77_011085 [Marasmius sp. AFHP31]